MSIAREISPIKAVKKSKNRPLPIWLQGLTVSSILGVIIVLYMSLVYAGTDVLQGDVQRIFYVHLGSFAGAFLAFGISVVGGIAYLRSRQNKWDGLSVAAIEVGLIFALVNLFTGSVWARPIWNTWWTWDPRLTSAAIMALTYAAYLMLRAGIESPDKRRLFSSVYAILAISTVIFTTVIIRIRPDTIHPAVIGSSPVNSEGGFEMAANMGLSLAITVAIVSLLIVPTLIWWRIRLENKLEQVKQLQINALNN